MNFNKLDHWTSLAQLLERGKFHGVFIADVLGGYDVYGGPQNMDASSKIRSPMARQRATVHHPSHGSGHEQSRLRCDNFNLIRTTISPRSPPLYHRPPHQRPVSSLNQPNLPDTFSLAWNVVTGYLDSAARNLGHTSQPAHDERYAICDEYMAVTYKLWNASWRSDAVKLDAARGIYTDPELVREINHQGKYFTVPGPHICAPSPQRTPVIFQAGTSHAGQAFAAKHAEAVFVSGHSPAASAKGIAGIRKAAKELGRGEYDVKVLAKICPIIGRTEEEAWAKYRDYVQYGSYEGALALFGGWTGTDMAPYGDDEELHLVENNAIRSYIEGLMNHGPKVGKWTKRTLAEHIMVGGLGPTPVGTPAQVADEFERWVKEADVDGFNIAYAIMPQTFTDVIELLLPELRKRGLFWDDYAVPGGTYRENLLKQPGQSEPLSSHPAEKYIWRAQQSQVNGDSGGFGDEYATALDRPASKSTWTWIAPQDEERQRRDLSDEYATALLRCG